MEINIFRQLAQELRLHVDEDNSIMWPTLTLSGLFEGIPIFVHKRPHFVDTRAMIAPAVTFPFVVGPETILTKLGHVFGVHDDEIGDPDFDKAFKIETPHVGALKKLLTPKLREALNVAKAADVPFKLTEQAISISIAHSNIDPPTHQNVLNRMQHASRLAQAVREAALTL